MTPELRDAASRDRGEAPFGEAVAAQPADVVTADSGEALLVVPVRCGVADLREAAALTGRARRIFESLAGGASGASGEALLDPPADRAFLEDLSRRGLLAVLPGEADPAPSTAAAPAPPPPPVTIDAAAFEGLARAVLRAGHALRFEARGFSMRPQVPDGSVIEAVAARPEDVRRGEIVLYTAGAHRLVAHRVVGRGGGRLLARGDSAARLDRVAPEDLLGVVRSRYEALPGGGVRQVRLDGPGRRLLGAVSGPAWLALASAARVLVIAPLRRFRGLRRAAGFVFRAGAGGFRLFEDLAFRLRRRAEIARAALLSPEEMDDLRRRLYARRSVQDFTALDENLEAGLTLIEEVMLNRHPPPGRRVLVLGCGPGRESVALARRGFDVTGIDREEGMLARARTLAAGAGTPVRFVNGDAVPPDLPGETFDAVMIWSGLCNMVLPRERRVRMLDGARRLLAPGGRVYVTFLSDYVPPGSAPPPRRASVLSAINPAHEPGDLFLLNEAVHIHPHPDLLAAEARDAGLAVVALWRDQRAYDRARGQVRGFVVLAAAGPPEGPAPAP